jgi:hypothetical protein
LLFDPWPKALHGGEQLLGAAIANANPHQTTLGRGRVGQIEKIFVLADDYIPVLAGVGPDLGIRRRRQFEVQHVLAHHASGNQKAGQGGRQLTIDQ